MEWPAWGDALIGGLLGALIGAFVSVWTFRKAEQRSSREALRAVYSEWGAAMSHAVARMSGVQQGFKAVADARQESSALTETLAGATRAAFAAEAQASAGRVIDAKLKSAGELLRHQLEAFDAYLHQVAATSIRLRYAEPDDAWREKARLISEAVAGAQQPMVTKDVQALAEAKVHAESELAILFTELDTREGFRERGGRMVRSLLGVGLLTLAACDGYVVGGADTGDSGDSSSDAADSGDSGGVEAALVAPAATSP